MRIKKYISIVTAAFLVLGTLLPPGVIEQWLADMNVVDSLFMSHANHNIVDNWSRVPKAGAQAANQTKFYFKNDTRTANTHFGIAGPTVENSPDADEVSGSPTGKTTAYSMAPIAGPISPTVTSDNVVGTRSTATNADKLWYRTFIMPLASGMTFTSSTTFQVAASFDESNASANAFPIGFAYVYDSGSNSNVKSLTTATQGANEIGTGDEGKVWSLTNNVGSNYTTDSNDFLAVEIWVNFTNTNGTAYTCTFRWGGNVVVADGTANTTPASYISIGTTTVDTFDPIYFTPTSTDREPTPGSHQTGDSFVGGTYDPRRAGTAPGAGAETNTQAVTTTVGNWRMNSWSSPPLAAQTIPSGNWLIHMHGDEANASSNAQFRYMVYVWKGDDTGIRGTVKAVANSGTEWSTATTNNQLEVVFAGSSVSVTAGDRLVVEVEIVTVTSSAAANVNHRFGSDPSTPGTSVYDSAILPPMNYGSSPAPLSFQAVQYEQLHYRFDADNDGESHAAWTDDNGTVNQDTQGTYAEDTNFRLRIQFRNNGGENGSVSPRLYYRTKGPPAGSWVQATNSSTDVKIVTSTQFAQGASTTRQLTDLSGSSWDFSAGNMIEDSGGATTPTTLGAWTYTEWEWSVYAATADTYEFKATDGSGTDFTTYTITPAVIITQAASLGITAPTNVGFANSNPGKTNEYTFTSGELVTVTDAGAGWSLTVVSTAFSDGGSNTISASNIKLRRDGVVTGGSDIYTIWSGTTTNVSEGTSGIVALNTAQSIGTRSSGTASETTNVRPTHQIVISPSQAIANYTGTLTYTVI